MPNKNIDKARQAKERLRVFKVANEVIDKNIKALRELSKV